MTGLRFIDQAIAIADANSESWCNAELHRERGELLLLEHGADADGRADAEFKVAIEIAIAQGAKLPELRASVARAKLHFARGRRQFARDLVAPIYAWFRDGHDTRDLLEAQKLLADLRLACA
jgi:hypothetical protein